VLLITTGLLSWMVAERACHTTPTVGCGEVHGNSQGVNELVSPAKSNLFVGGQNGTWFEVGQYPLLYQVSLSSDSYTRLDPVVSGGTVWGGGYNGSQVLVSGWGTDDHSFGPYVCLYDGVGVVARGSLDDYGNAASWSGGDVFSASYNGEEWLLSGLGSGVLPSYSSRSSNHMALATFTGSKFTDLSSDVPEQQDAILYTNAWNGQYWLVGGGYLSSGVLFTFDGNKIVDLTTRIQAAVRSFASVQALAWNGEYWLIGGIGFLAEYDGRNFTDLTQQLTHSLSMSDFNAVNALAWNGDSWMIGGGGPIAQVTTGTAWIASYGTAGFVNLSSSLPSYVTGENAVSSILGITVANGTWILGGYSNDRGILLTYHAGRVTDYSHLVSQFTYVDWVFASSA